jgi:UDP-galactopyranose mutase
MKILITGASGFIGNRFIKRAVPNVLWIGSYFSNKKNGLHFLDMTDKGSTFAFFKKHRPESVIHCAALPDVNYSETDKEKARLLNFTGTKNIADACKKFSVKMVFLSTDFIFDGTSGPYPENAKPHPLNYYGKLKLESEEYIKKNLSNHLIIRTTNVYGYDPESKNFAMGVIRALEQGRAFHAAADQYGNPTHVDDLVSAVCSLIRENKNGTFNAAGPDYINRHEFALMISKTFGLDKSLIMPMPTSMLGQAALRPKYGGLKNTKAKRMGIKFMNAKKGLLYMKKEMEKIHNPHTDVAILGGGLAGLSTAYHLRRDYELFERTDQVGKLCSSKNIDGFILDHGPHLFFSKDKYVVALMKKLLKGNMLVRLNKPGQYAFGHYIPYPYTANLRSLPGKVIEECINGFREAGQTRKNMPKPKNYEEWCYYYYGKGFANHFMLPYARNYWTVEPKTLTLEWIGNKIYLPTLKQVIEGSKAHSKKNYYYYSRYIYPKHNGAGALSNAFLDYIKNPQTGKEAVEIDISNRLIKFSDGTHTKYNCIVSTLSVPVLTSLIKQAPEDVIDAANKLINTSVICVLIGLDKPEVSKYSWIYFNEKNIIFFRLSFPNHFSPYTCPKGTSSIWAEIAYSNFKKINRGTVVKNVIRDLKKLSIIKPNDRIITTGYVDLRNAYVIYDKNRMDNIAKIHDFLEKNKIYSCGRFAEWAYMWTHDVILSSRRLAEKLNKEKAS